VDNWKSAQQQYKRAVRKSARGATAGDAEARHVKGHAYSGLGRVCLKLGQAASFSFKSSKSCTVAWARGRTLLCSAQTRSMTSGRRGQCVGAFHVSASKREDIGALLGRAGDLIENSVRTDSQASWIASKG
jgi:hypothetical protein